jgi:two-component system response regulator NreC
MDMAKTRILIADDHDVVRSGLKGLLQRVPTLSVVGEAANGEEAVRLAERFKPDIVIMDISMPVLNGIEATRQIKTAQPEVKVIILSVHEDEEYAYQILRAGASGYLLKNASKQDILAAIDSAVSGERFFSPGISRLIVDGFLKRAKEGTEMTERPAMETQLSPRELEILTYIARGFTNRKIAETLFLSVRTVNTHRTNIMQKLNIHDTAGLVRHALTLGLVKPGT